MKSLLTATLVTCAAAALAAQNPMREGRWEVTMQMDMPGMPMKMPANKVVRCITKKDLEAPDGGLPGGPDGKKSDACKVTDRKTEGNKVTWKMACAPPQNMSGSGEIVFNGDSYDGTMTMTTDRGAMTMKYNAKRLGDCTE